MAIALLGGRESRPLAKAVAGGISRELGAKVAAAALVRHIRAVTEEVRIGQIQIRLMGAKGFGRREGVA